MVAQRWRTRLRWRARAVRVHCALEREGGTESSQSVLLGRETEGRDARLGEEAALDVGGNGLRRLGRGRPLLPGMDGIGTKCAISVVNAGAGLDMSMRTLDLEPHDEVIVPSINFWVAPMAVLGVGSQN